MSVSQSRCLVLQKNLNKQNKTGKTSSFRKTEIGFAFSNVKVKCLFIIQARAKNPHITYNILHKVFELSTWNISFFSFP